MCGWLWASMSGLTRSATRAHRAAIGGQAREPIELARRFHVDGEQVERHRAFELVCALAHAGEDDLVRPEAAAQRDFHLAHRIGVGAAAERAHQANDGERGVGLERVVDRVRHGPNAASSRR